MTDCIIRWFSLFAAKTGIAGKFTPDEKTLDIMFFVIGILFIFAGIKLFRLTSSVLIFTAVSVVLCTLMKGRAGWGAIVTAFTIIGCLCAYMVFNWKSADAIAISALTAALITWKLCPLWWAALLVGILIGTAAGIFPLIGVTVSTAAAGVVLLAEGVLGGISFLIPLLIGAAGFAVQFFLIGRRQKLFAKTIPDKLRHRLEKMRR